jgi:hypothetical protein
MKPLDGSPVGRTVLQCFPDEPAEPDRKEQFRRDTEQEKRAGCERLEKAKRFAVSFNGLLGEAFSNGFLRCLVHFSLSSPCRLLGDAFLKRFPSLSSSCTEA